MTQAINLANFSNSLDSSGGVPPTQLNAVVPISKGGTNASTASAARTNLGSTTVGDAVFIAANAAAARTAIGTVIGTDVPSPTGTGASGTWAINITGNAATATSATNAGNVTGTVAIANGGTGQTSAAAAGSALGAIGQGQTWQSPSRVIGTTYTNSTGRPIQVNICVQAPGSNGYASVTVGGVIIGYLGIASGGLYPFYLNISFIVPASTNYSCNVVSGTSPSLVTWAELR
jgi:hypothetical protein